MDRIKEYDITSGILIIYMIFSHISSNTEFLSRDTYVVWRSLFTYFMAWFFFKAGIFYRERPIKFQFNNILVKLVRPYFFFSLIGYIIVFAKLVIEHDVSMETTIFNPLKEIFFEGSLQGNKPMWFLLSLAGVRICFSVLRSFVGNPFLITLTSITCYSIILTWKDSLSNIPFWTINMCLALFFYSLGQQNLVRIENIKQGGG